MIVLCSGGFDPLHVGHVNYLQVAASNGWITIALNSDAWLSHKKGYFFMTWQERARILNALWCVHDVYQVKDVDGTVCEALRQVKPDIFANGGDRIEANPAEHAACEELGIEELFNVGGGKVRSSSELVKATYDHHANALQD